MDSKLSASMAALRKVVKSPHPAMFWQETMGHVAVVLDHLQELISDGSTAPAIEVQPGDHSELRRIAVALKNPLLNGQEASDLMVRYEALTMPDHIIALIDGLPQHVLDKQCRDDVARALGLCPNQERGFAWSYLLTSIKSCVKASEDTCRAQHSVPAGWKLVPIEPTPEMLDARRDCEDGMDGYLVEDTEYYFPDRGAVRDFLACVYHGMLPRQRPRRGALTMSVEAYIRGMAARGFSRSAAAAALGMHWVKFMDLLERMPDIEWGYPYKSFDRRRHAKNLKGYRFRDSEGRQRSVAALRAVNQARRHEYTVFGVTDSLSNLVKRFGCVAKSTVQKRLAKGMSIEQALTTPRSDHLSGLKRKPESHPWKRADRRGVINHRERQLKAKRDQRQAEERLHG